MTSSVTIQHNRHGVVYIAFGQTAYGEVEQSIAMLKRNNDYPITVITDAPQHFTDMQKSRWAKVNLFDLSPYDCTLYLDADTRPYENLKLGFNILADGWDLVIVPSENQEQDLLWHVDQDEKQVTLNEAGPMIQWQGGVFWFRKNERTALLFECWHDEWQHWKGQDQGALMRALARCSVRLWALGRPFNGGAVVGHLFGRARG